MTLSEHILWKLVIFITFLTQIIGLCVLQEEFFLLPTYGLLGGFLFSHSIGNSTTVKNFTCNTINTCYLFKGIPYLIGFSHIVLL